MNGAADAGDDQQHQQAQADRSRKPKSTFRSPTRSQVTLTSSLRLSIRQTQTNKTMLRIKASDDRGDGKPRAAARGHAE